VLEDYRRSRNTTNVQKGQPRVNAERNGKWALRTTVSIPNNNNNNETSTDLVRPERAHQCTNRGVVVAHRAIPPAPSTPQAWHVQVQTMANCHQRNAVERHGDKEGTTKKRFLVQSKR
jgi:hypothetical protein